MSIVIHLPGCFINWIGSFTRFFVTCVARARLVAAVWLASVLSVVIFRPPHNQRMSVDATAAGLLVRLVRLWTATLLLKGFTVRKFPARSFSFCSSLWTVAPGCASYANVMGVRVSSLRKKQKGFFGPYHYIVHCH